MPPLHPATRAAARIRGPRAGGIVGVAVIVAILGAAWLFGLVRFVSAPGIAVLPLPRQATPPREAHDLAAWRYGPLVRASSYYRDPISQHHPLFLVDGRVAPTLLEKWMSSEVDPAPFIEIIWREPHDLDRVVIKHAGEYESASLTLARYRLSCLQQEAGQLRVGITLEVEGNRASLAVHPLSCPHARGIRLDGHPRSAGEPIRIYEIEAWGT